MILEWVAIPFSKESSDPGIKPQTRALQADSLLTELPGKPTYNHCYMGNTWLYQAGYKEWAEKEDNKKRTHWAFSQVHKTDSRSPVKPYLLGERGWVSLGKTLALNRTKNDQNGKGLTV